MKEPSGNTRLLGSTAIADAAAIALATYPARTPETRPAAVILAEARDWHTGLAASVLLLLSIGGAGTFDGIVISGLVAAFFA